MDSNLGNFGIIFFSILRVQFILNLGHFIYNFSVGGQFRAIILLSCGFIHWIASTALTLSRISTWASVHWWVLTTWFILSLLFLVTLCLLRLLRIILRLRYKFLEFSQYFPIDSHVNSWFFVIIVRKQIGSFGEQEFQTFSMTIFWAKVARCVPIYIFRINVSSIFNQSLYYWQYSSKARNMKRGSEIVCSCINLGTKFDKNFDEWSVTFTCS